MSAILVCFAVVVDCFQEYIALRNLPSYPWRLVPLNMEERSAKGKGIAVPALPSLPPRPYEISSEAVSQGSHSGQARPAEASANLRVSPLIAAALSLAQRQVQIISKARRDRAAGARASNHPGASRSSFTGGPASSPASSSEALHAEGGQTGAEGSGLSLQFTRSIGVLSAKSPLLKALTTAITRPF